MEERKELQGMLALARERLRAVFETADAPDAKSLRECVAVLKELTALQKELGGETEEGQAGGVIVLPEAKENEE